MTTAVIKLTKGARSIDLMSAPYEVGPDFRPPATAYNVGLSGGGSANITGGALVYARKYINQEIEFQVKIESTSDGSINDAVRALTALLVQAGDEFEPLYLEYKSNSDTPEPLWGQYGANYRYTIVSGTVSGLWEFYGTGTIRARAVFVTLQLTIKPFALGKEQILATATGGIIEDMIGSVDGRSKGTYIPEATINLVNNPVFGNGTWSACWTAGASILSASTIDVNYTLPGTLVSAYLQQTGAGATTANQFSTQVAAASPGQWVSISCYAKRQDSAAVSASDLVLVYGAAASRTTTFASVGNGWYRLTASNLSGSAAACAVGVQLQSRKAIYVSGFQFEEKAYYTPLAVGDFNGCSWTSGSAAYHIGTTTRPAAVCKIPLDNSVLKTTDGSVRIVINADSLQQVNQMLFDTRDAAHTDSLYFSHSYADGYYLGFNGGEYNLNSAQMTTGDNTLHVTWGGGTITGYLNGASIGSTAYTATLFGANLFIGSDYSSACQLLGKYKSFATFDRALTSTEVANDYNNLAALLAKGQRPDRVPWFWTNSGDNVLSLDTGKTPRGVVHGISDTGPAETTIFGAMSNDWRDFCSIGFSNFKAPYHIPLFDKYLFQNLSGATATNAYASDVKVSSITTTASAVWYDVSVNLTPLAYEASNGKEFYLLARMKTAGSANITINPRLDVGAFSAPRGSTMTLRGDTRAITSASNYRLLRSKPIVLRNNRQYYGSDVFITSGDTYNIVLGLEMSGSAGTLSASTDYLALAARPFALLGNASMTNGYQNFVYRGNRAGVSNGQTVLGELPVTGDVIELEPNQYNMLLTFIGTAENIDPLITYTLTFNKIKITPRYLLL